MSQSTFTQTQITIYIQMEREKNKYILIQKTKTILYYFITQKHYNKLQNTYLYFIPNTFYRILV